MMDYRGKQNHMASASSELCNNYNVEITRASTLLIDDDDKNVEIALAFGVRAIIFLPDFPNRLVLNSCFHSIH